MDKTISAGKNLVEKGSQTVENLTASKERLTLDEFAGQPVVAGIRSDLVETLYAEGIHSAQAFKEWTEKDLLALKGIGPATVKNWSKMAQALKIVIFSLLNGYKFVKILAIRGALSWSVTESGGVEKSAQMSRLEEGGRKKKYKKRRPIFLV